MNEILMSKDKVIDVEEYEIELLMAKEEALKLTKDIQSTTTALYILLKRAHDEKAWVSLGYKSWSHYIESEFEFSRARSYQLLNQARVIEVINEASGVPIYLSERDARSITKRLPEITEKLEEVKNEDLPAEETKEKVEKIIENHSNDEIDRAQEFDSKKSSNGQSDEYDDKYEDNGAMEEWKPEGIDMEAMKNMLSDENKFYYNNLLVTLEIFESMPEPKEFGMLISKSNEDKKKLLNLIKNAEKWIKSLTDEIK